MHIEHKHTLTHATHKLRVPTFLILSIFPSSFFFDFIRHALFDSIADCRSMHWLININISFFFFFWWRLKMQINLVIKLFGNQSNPKKYEWRIKQWLSKGVFFWRKKNLNNFCIFLEINLFCWMSVRKTASVDMKQIQLTNRNLKHREWTRDESVTLAFYSVMNAKWSKNALFSFLFFSKINQPFCLVRLLIENRTKWNGKLYVFVFICWCLGSRWHCYAKQQEK